MTSWFDPSGDRAFGPQFKDKFDFTLQFEHTILTILPATIFVAAVPIFFFIFQSRPNIVRPGKLLQFKLGAALALVAAETTNLVLWAKSKDQFSGEGVAALSLLCLVALSLIPLIHWEHQRTLRSTTFVAFWLFFTILCDSVRARSYFLRPGLKGIAIGTTVAAALKCILLGLQELSKASLIIDDHERENAGEEATSGFISRTLFIWLNRMFFFGFRRIMRLEELDNLGPSFRSRFLLEQIDALWTAGNGFVSGSLELACLRVCFLPWLAAAFPRLCLSAFTVSQPLLLQSVVTYVQNEEKTPGHRDGLIVAATLVYGGLAVSKASYDHVSYRIATKVRGMLISQSSRKGLKLKYTEAQSMANVSLMNTDIFNISMAIPRLHRMWAANLELGVNLYVLATIVGPATSLVTFTIVVTAIGSYVVGKKMPLAQKDWTASIADRVEKTSKMLSQIKAIKMTGLEDVMATYVQNLRETEVGHSKRTRVWLLRLYVIGTFCDCITAPIVLAGGIFWTGLGGDFTPANVFTTLAVVTLIGSILKYFPDEYALIQNGRVSFKRFEEYLASEEWQDPRCTDLAVFQNDIAAKNVVDEHVAEVDTLSSSDIALSSSRVIEFYHAEIAVEGTDEVVFFSLNVAIERHEIVMVVGPTGCGKSTFLRAILGEIELLSGAIYVESGHVAFCDQTAWLWNASIQENIIGDSPVDMNWYYAVVDGCLLRKDFQNLRRGDQTKVGSNGGNLSGGQKQRVALARAIYARSPFLVLDDLFAALDRKTAAEIFSRLFGPNGLVRKSLSTVIMATHSIQFLSAADRIVVLEKGQDAISTTDITQVIASEPVQTICNEISKHQREENDEDDIDYDLAADVPEADRDQHADDIARQRGDLTIYPFYLRTFPSKMPAIWLSWVILTVIAEVFSDGYVRIWMELDPTNKLLYLGYALIGASAACFATMHLETMFLKIIPYSSLLLHRMLFEILMRAKLSFLTGTDHGSLVNRISQDLTLISSQLPMGGMRTIYYCFRMLLRFTLIIVVTKYTTSILPVVIGIIFVVQLFYLRTSRQLRYLELETKAPLVAQFTEAASGLYHIRAYGWQHQNLSKSLELLDDSQKPYYYLYAAERWLSLVMDSLSLFIAVTLIAITVWLDYIASASGIGLSMLSLITLSFDCMSFVREWMLLETSIGALARTRDFVRDTPLEEDPENPTRPPPQWPQHGRIVMEDVVAKYDWQKAGPPVLDSVSLDIPPQAKVGIVGRTGSGKSSILMTLLGFLDYTGKITIDGIDISKIHKKKLRSIITAISQEDLNLEGTVRYNLFPETYDPDLQKNPFNEYAAIELLRRLGLLDIINQHNGLDTKMGDLGLSHGQKQLMSIARSCIRHYTHDTRIIVMDEATSNLDHSIQKEVLQIFRELFYDCTIFAVAHREETIKGYDFRMTMADGKLESLTHVVGKEDEDKDEDEDENEVLESPQAPETSQAPQPSQATEPSQPPRRVPVIKLSQIKLPDLPDRPYTSSEEEFIREAGRKRLEEITRSIALREERKRRGSASSDELPECVSRKPSVDISKSIPLASSNFPPVAAYTGSSEDIPFRSRMGPPKASASSSRPRPTGPVPMNPFFEHMLRLSEESIKRTERWQATPPEDRKSTSMFQVAREIRQKIRAQAAAEEVAKAKKAAEKAEKEAKKADKQAKKEAKKTEKQGQRAEQATTVEEKVEKVVEDTEDLETVIDEKGKGRAE